MRKQRAPRLDSVDEAARHLAELVRLEGVGRSAVPMLEWLAARGSLTAAEALMFIFRDGVKSAERRERVPRDLHAAEKWARRLLAAKAPDARFSLACVVDMAGRTSEARRLYVAAFSRDRRRSAMAGTAAHNVAMTDFAEGHAASGVRWLEKAIGAGDIESAVDLYERRRHPLRKRDVDRMRELLRACTEDKGDRVTQHARERAQDLLADLERQYGPVRRPARARR